VAAVAATRLPPALRGVAFRPVADEREALVEAAVFAVVGLAAGLEAAVFVAAVLVAAVFVAAVLRAADLPVVALRAADLVTAVFAVVAFFAGSDWSSTTSVAAFFCTERSADTAARFVS